MKLIENISLLFTTILEYFYKGINNIRIFLIDYKKYIIPGIIIIFLLSLLWYVLGEAPGPPTVLMISDILIALIAFIITRVETIKWIKKNYKKFIIIMAALGTATGGVIYFDSGPEIPDLDIPEPFIYTDFIPPKDSFGMGETIFKDVNISFYRSWLNTTVVWSLQKSVDNVHWVDCTKLLVVKKDWNAINLSEKHTLSWVSDENAYYQLLLRTDNVKSYQDKSISAKDIEDKILLNFSITESEDYNIYYDWSDYKNSPEAGKTVMVKDVTSVSNKQTFNWRVYTSVRMAKGEKMLIDPTFGYSSGSHGLYIYYKGDEYWYMDSYAPSSSGTADNITIYTDSGWDVDITIQCALYEYVDDETMGNLIATTESRSGLSADTAYDFDFSEPKPSVTEGTDYYMAVGTVSNLGSDGHNSVVVLYDSGETTWKLLKELVSGGVTWDSPMDAGWDIITKRQLYIYCSYTEGGGEPENNNPSITASSENPLNQSTNVGLSLIGNYSHFNISVSDLDDATQDMNITWSTNESGSWTVMGTNTSVSNGTYYCTNVSWVDSYSTTYWWNVSVNDGNGGWANSSFSFTTSAGGDTYTATIRNDGIDYFVWLGDDDGTASTVAEDIADFDESAEYIAAWVGTTWDIDDGLWIYYYGDESGTDFDVDVFDIIKVYLTDSGTQEISMDADSGTDYTSAREVTLTNDINNGGNYVGWTDDAATTASEVANTHISTTLDAGEFIYYWDETNYEWDYYIVGFLEPSITITEDDVLFISVADSETFNIGGKAS